jgi:anti-sigma-K factor RskA
MNTDDRFDQALRAVHAQAVSQVSPATMAELHRRRHAALQAGQSRPWLSGWRGAVFASFAVVAVALGTGYGLLREGQAPQPAPAVADLSQPAEDLADTYAPLDESPDFYLWLASSDATLLAME